MKRNFTLLVIIVLTLLLSACWPGEIGVDTVMDENGMGHRDYFVVVYDDSLSETPITNPDDPDGTKGNGPVLNDKHITGGVEALQEWFETNAPEFMEVLPMETEGNQRIFTLRMTFDSFEDFLDKYEQLVNLSPNLSWDDFTEAEKPSFTTSEEDGMTYVSLTESKVLLEASFDWAIDGIFNSIFDAADLAGFVDKASITEFATYKTMLGDEALEITSEYDATVVNDNQSTGAVVFIDQDSFTLTYSYETPANNTVLLVAIGAGVVVIAGLAFVFMKKKA